MKVSGVWAAAFATALGGALLLYQPQAEAQDTPLKNVTFTNAQADRGRTEYTRSCADCHGPNLNDGEFGGAPLKGSHFETNWGGQSADLLYGYLSSTMPPDRPGRLSPQAYADSMAFILRGNGYQAGAQELPSDIEQLAEYVLEK